MGLECHRYNHPQILFYLSLPLKTSLPRIHHLAINQPVII
jgi:hypothetical protein